MALKILKWLGIGLGVMAALLLIAGAALATRGSQMVAATYPLEASGLTVANDEANRTEGELLSPFAPAGLVTARICPAPISKSVSAECGEYLATTCTGCHKPDFSGGASIGSDPANPAPANLSRAGPRLISS